MRSNFRTTSTSAAVLALATAAACGAFAGERKAPAPADAHQAIERFLHEQARGVPGRVEITLTASATAQLPPCGAPEAFLPPAARAWGRVTVGVRCDGEAPWTRYVPAYVAVIAEYQAATRTIESGEPLSEGDFQPREGDLAALPGGLVTEAAEAAGKLASRRIAAGAPLRRELLRGVPVIQQGQDVRVTVRGPGYTLGTEGKAMAQAMAGSTVQVRTRGGRVLSGVAQADGSVERPH